jgi:DNA-binding NtrC family response regulator
LRSDSSSALIGCSGVPSVRGTVLIVDDLALARRALARELQAAGFDVVEACNGQEGWEAFSRARPDAVVTDLVMPGSDGQDLLERIRAQSDDVPIILFSAKGGVSDAVSALKAGADDFISSPGTEIEDLVERLAAAIAARRDAPASPELESQLESRLVGESHGMAEVRRRIASLAPLRAPVLVIGEPGTGRDATVEALHEFGSTAGGELTRLDCRFLGAGAGSPACGALYLDHVDHLTEEAHPDWEERLAGRDVDGSARLPRVFASTSDPRLERLRDGLRGRLLRISIELPPLRERAEDIPELADALVRKIGRRVGRRVELTQAARTLLAEQQWPGNVAQLGQVLERAIAFGQGGKLRRETLERVMAEACESVDRLRERRETRERLELLEALRDTEGNVTHVADRLGKSRAAIYRMIEKYGIALSAPRTKS